MLGGFVFGAARVSLCFVGLYVVGLFVIRLFISVSLGDSILTATSVRALRGRSCRVALGSSPSSGT
jgi:hypothetical protein